MVKHGGHQVSYSWLRCRLSTGPVFKTSTGMFYNYYRDQYNYVILLVPHCQKYTDSL